MILEILSRDDKKWHDMVRNMGCAEHMVDDVVQEMYIKMHTFKNPERIMYNESQVNHFYIYLTLRSVFVDMIKDEKIYAPEEDMEPLVTDNGMCVDEDAAWQRMYEMVRDGINEFGPYGAKLCFSYFKTDKSLREMAEESGISLTSLFNSQRKYRDELIERFGEDYEDLKNGDYDKI